MTLDHRPLGLLVASVCLLGSPASAGPPAICHEIDIGKSVQPLEKRSYSTTQLIDQTVTTLDKDRSALVHMETLRRAAVKTDGKETGTCLLAELMARALDAEAAGKPDALAWFDAGYLAQCYDQLNVRLEIRCGRRKGVVGYAWVSKALEIAGDDAEMEFGAAMVTVLAGIPEHKQHVDRVRDLADEDSLVIRNLDYHASKYWRHHRRRSGA